MQTQKCLVLEHLTESEPDNSYLNGRGQGKRLVPLLLVVSAGFNLCSSLFKECFCCTDVKHFLPVRCFKKHEEKAPRRTLSVSNRNCGVLLP